jgi:hypothetical protein
MRIKNCEHCGDDYNATKSNQKYCSNSCRTRACYERNQYKYVQGENYVRGGYYPSKENDNIIEKVVDKSEINNQQGNFGDAILGTMIGNIATNLLTDLLTENHNKPATKGDLYKVVQLIQEVEEVNTNRFQTLGKNQVKIYNLLNKLSKELIEENNIKGGMNKLL